MSWIDRDDVKPFVNEVGIDTNNTLLDLAASAACDQITKYCGWSFDVATSATARYYVPVNFYDITVDGFSSTTGLTVKVDRDNDGVYEETLVLNTDFYLVPNGNGRPYTAIYLSGTSFPLSIYNRPSVEVTARWGWSATPDAVTYAACLLASRLYRRSKTPDGSGLFLAGADVTVLWSDPDVKNLLVGYRDAQVGFA